MANPNPSPATRWKPGQSGNPHGRRPQPITQALAAKLSERDAQTIADVVIERALAGDPWAVGFVADRLEGKAVARNESGDPGAFEVPLGAIKKRLKIVPKPQTP